MNEIIKVISKMIESSKQVNEIADKIKSIKVPNIKFEILKSPRWADDAIILKSTAGSQKFTIKIHYDKYPLACHMYNSPKLLEKLKQCNYISHIEKTFICKNTNQEFIRCVIYHYIDGDTLEKNVRKCKPQDIIKLQNLLKKCTCELFKMGVNPFIRDLADFIVVKDGSEERVVLTDYNALMDCHNASEYSRSEIMSIMDSVIEKTVTKNYKSFVSTRPTLTDL